MSNKNSQELGTKPIGELLVKMGVPASVGILVMSIYMIVDTIFIGRYVGATGIAAISVVLPITFLISSIGMAIGVGGSSVISRALGAKDEEHANNTFGNMLSLTLILSVLLVIGGYFYGDSILRVFGAKEGIFAPAQEYFGILLPGIPCLAFAMMSNNVVRGEGEPNYAMAIMLVPAVLNLILDPIFIAYYDMGMAGAAWATTISYVASAAFAAWYFLSGRSDLKITYEGLILKWELIKEIFSIGAVTFARQGVISFLMLVLNNTLLAYGGEVSVAMFGIINRLGMLSNFPVLGLTQGFLPIAGFNFGAKKYKRVKETIFLSIKVGTVIAIGIFVLVLVFREELVRIFVDESEIEVLAKTPPAMLIVFLGLPLIQLQLIGSAYFQAIGKAIPALLLTLSKQAFFLIPLVFILPQYFGLNGVWMAFPISDILATGLIFFYLRKEIVGELDVLIVGELEEKIK